MRVKIIACLALAALFVFAPAASASLARFTFPVIKPVYASDSDDMGMVMKLIDDTVKFSKDEVASLGANPSVADFPGISGPLKSMPGPETLLSMLAPPVKSDQAARDNIYRTLVGTNITYYSIAGKPMNYTITADSIKSVEKTVYKNKLAWKVRIGEDMAWDLIIDASGKNILDTKQLFYT